jgi:hypothetical protein
MMNHEGVESETGSIGAVYKGRLSGIRGGVNKFVWEKKRRTKKNV